MNFNTGKYRVPISIFNIGISFQDKKIYIGLLNEDTQFERGRGWQYNFSEFVKDFNEGNFVFKDKIDQYKNRENTKTSKINS